MRPIAALCVSRRSEYKAMPDVECYDIDRDVRTFQGGMPIVAHPPCRAWSAYCGHQAKPLPGEKELGPLCVALLLTCGGVLVHPAHSRLWTHYNLPLPSEPCRDGLWSMAVSQAWWGDSCKKNTWLLFCGITADQLPEIPYRLREETGDRRRWQVMSKHQRSHSVKEFAEWLVEVARRVEPQHG